MRIQNREQYLLLGQNVAYYRRLKSLTQEELAGMVGMSKGYLSKIERGNYNKSVSLTIVIQIAIALNISIAQLFERPKA